jgi:tetratricopeptide (TPR) repeat protein
MMSTSSGDSDWDNQVLEVAKRSLEFDPAKIERSIARLRELLEMPGLSEQQKANGLISYATALRHHGKHKLALQQLEKIQPNWINNDDKLGKAHVDLLKAASLAHLAKCDEALRHAASVTDALSAVPVEMRAGFSLQLSEVFLLCGAVPEAIGACETAMRESEHRQSVADEYGRAMANLATIKLHHSRDEQAESEGVRLMERSIELKVERGDLQGLANAYNSLALYYAKAHRYERAIAFFRKDQQISLQIGDLSGLAQTKLHLADLYSYLLQPNPALKKLEEAKDLIKQVANESLQAAAEMLERAIKERRTSAVETGEQLGPNAACRCGSGKTYRDCCGRADFEPVSLPWDLKSHSEATATAYAELKNMGLVPTRLDFFFHPGTEKINRTAWYRLAPRDGWAEVLELPDVANMQLRCASLAVAAAELDADSVEHPLSAVILAVCATEAFINQVVFFISEVSKTESVIFGGVPREVLADPASFQRTTELTTKWNLLGKAVCGSHWPPEPKLFDDFKTLVRVRNEFVHFKLTAYEQILPPANEVPAILRALPSEVILRETPHSWPFRLLTVSTAKWSTEVAFRLMEGFRKAYIANRMSQTNV